MTLRFSSFCPKLKTNEAKLPTKSSCSTLRSLTLPKSEHFDYHFWLRNDCFFFASLSSLNLIRDEFENGWGQLNWISNEKNQLKSKHKLTLSAAAKLTIQSLKPKSNEFQNLNWIILRSQWFDSSRIYDLFLSCQRIQIRKMLHFCEFIFSGWDFWIQFNGKPVAMEVVESSMHENCQRLFTPKETKIDAHRIDVDVADWRRVTHRSIAK